MEAHEGCGCKSPHSLYTATSLGRAWMAIPTLGRPNPRGKPPVQFYRKLSGPRTNLDTKKISTPPTLGILPGPSSPYPSAWALQLPGPHNNFIPLPYFILPLVGTFTWLSPPGFYRAMTCRERELTVDNGRLARWIKWRACDVGEAKERMENDCDIGEVTERLENELCSWGSLPQIVQWSFPYVLFNFCTAVLNHPVYRLINN